MCGKLLCDRNMTMTKCSASDLDEQTFFMKLFNSNTKEIKIPSNTF